MVFDLGGWKSGWIENYNLIEKKIERTENIVYINFKLYPYYIKQNVTFFFYYKICAWTLFFLNTSQMIHTKKKKTNKQMRIEEIGIKT